MDVALFLVLFAASQIAPFVLAGVLWRIHVLSPPAAIIAAAVSAFITAGCWYIAFTDESSSTAVVAVLYAPVFSIPAVMLVIGVDQATRAAARRWRHGHQRPTAF